MIVACYLDEYSSYRLVGSLRLEDDVSEFRYSENYMASPGARPLFSCLPLSDKSITGSVVRASFEALTPEGYARTILSDRYSLDYGDYVSLLLRLGDETIGALVITEPGKPPGASAHYEPIGETLFDDFARMPRTVAAQVVGEVRLSLSGEMTKIGVYQDLGSGEWFLPFGTAPTTHIVKAPSGDYKDQTINEAICLMAAKNLEIEAADVTLREAGNGTPLLFAKRFDRVFDAADVLIDGHRKPRRVHQEDMCQALGMPGTFKYEPSEAEYLELIAGALSRATANAYGERHILFEQIIYRYAIGDCDGHLKNYSILYPKLNDGMVSPLYDVTSTTIYPMVSREMGVRLNRDRIIDHVSPEDLYRTISRLSIPEGNARDLIENIALNLEAAIETARDHLIDEGFEQARSVADSIIASARPRLDMCRRSLGLSLKQLDEQQVTYELSEPSLDEDIARAKEAALAANPSTEEALFQATEEARHRAGEYSGYSDFDLGR